jgi:hypothetical protein
MAIISIPSSIGGITVPGLATNGPLGILFNNPFASLNLQYPRDLQSSARGHYVTFEIKDINPIGYESDATYTLGGGISNAVSGGVSQIAQGVTNTIENFFSGTNTTASSATLSPQTYTPRGSISLYIPETMNFTYNQQYNSISATAVGAQAIGAALDTVGKFIPGNIAGKAISSAENIVSGDAVKLGLKSAGLAINPKLQMLYEGVGFREYQMAFTFTPYSQQEADAVANIIKTFKEYSAPRIVKGGTGGMFFIPPAVFQPTFFFNGKINNKVNQVTESVITNVDVNYGPNGWATFNDGSPVQTTLTLQFQETQILDRDTLKKGNY